MRKSSGGAAGRTGEKSGSAAPSVRLPLPLQKDKRHGDSKKYDPKREKAQNRREACNGNRKRLSIV
jgi:hypothetical protein